MEPNAAAAARRKRAQPEPASTSPIRFYQTTGPYGCFSNFSRHSVELDGKIWPTSEHYFQAQKFAGTPYEEEIRSIPSPMEAASLGRDRSLPIRGSNNNNAPSPLLLLLLHLSQAYWDQVKDDIMRKALRAKFTQHENCKRYAYQ